MKFPKEIKEAIKECIISIIWPKEDIVSFLKKNGCTKDDLAPIRKPQDLTRVKMVHLIFRQLTWRKDEGIPQFMSMNRALLNWKGFNKHYFEDLKKLNREDADKAIANLVDAQFYLDSQI